MYVCAKKVDKGHHYIKYGDIGGSKWSHIMVVFFFDGNRTGKIGKIQKFGVCSVFRQYFLELFIFACLPVSIEQGDVKDQE